MLVLRPQAVFLEQWAACRYCRFSCVLCARKPFGEQQHYPCAFLRLYDVFLAFPSLCSLLYLAKCLRPSSSPKIAINALSFSLSRHLRQYGCCGMSGSKHGQNATACTPHTQHLQSLAFTIIHSVNFFFKRIFHCQ